MKEEQHSHPAHPGSSPVRRGEPLVCSLPALTPGARVLLTPHPELLPGSYALPLSHTLQYGPLASLAVGTRLLAGEGEESPEHPLLVITGRFTIPVAQDHVPPSYLPYTADGGVRIPAAHALSCFLAEAVCGHPGGEVPLVPCRGGVTLAWVTLSDKGAAGLREDESGPRIGHFLADVLPLAYSQGFILPDNPDALRALVADLALHQGYDLVVTTGGTGLGPRDTTPEALLPLLQHRLPGFEQAMMAASLAKTPHAAISRAFVGTMGQSLVMALPGSKKAVRENLEAVAQALAHALAKLQGDPADCG